MLVKIITLAFSDSLSGFDDTPLRDFMARHQVYKIKLEFIELSKIILIGSIIFFFYMNISIDSPIISIIVKLTSIPVGLLLARLFNLCNCKKLFIF